MRLREILSTKGSAVHTIGPSATLANVVEELVEKNCGSLVVVDGGQMIGIITERDIMRACVNGAQSLNETRVLDVMTGDVISGSPNDSVNDTMGLMTDHRVRHLPVLDNQGQLAGLISIGDVVKAQHDSLSMENHYLKSYIQS
jgi:CBS domain-containing protein